KEHFIETQRFDHAEARRVVVNEGLAVTKEGVVDGVPVTAEFVGNLLHAATVLTDLSGQPATRAIGDEQARKANAGVDLAPRAHGTECVGTEEAPLVPH